MSNLMFKHFIGLALLLSLAACGEQVGLTPTPPTITLPTPALTAVSPSPSAVIPSPTGDIPNPRTLPIPPQPTPENVIGGSTVQDGPFTFFLWLFRDPRMNLHPVATSLYSDLDGVGIYQCWVYQGPDLNGPAQVYWGTLPQLDLIIEYPSLTGGQGDGRLGGVMLPGGFFMPGRSNPGDQVQVAMKVVTPQGEYGAVLAFTLQQGANGFEPTDITVEILPLGFPPTEVSVEGIVAVIVPDARLITLAEPVQGISTLALTEDARLEFADWQGAATWPLDADDKMTGF